MPAPLPAGTGVTRKYTLAVVVDPGVTDASGLAAGMIFINGNVTSYPQLPFGAVQSSGHGQEFSIQWRRCSVTSSSAAWLALACG